MRPETRQPMQGGLDRLCRILALTTVCLMVFSSSVLAQYLTFGKNKVQYDSFDWRLLESEHFRLYFYPAEEELARIALEMGEEGYENLRRYFIHEIDRPIPLIIYSSHQDFEQTNVTPFLLPEGVAGLTEYRRGRVLIPFNGSLNDFRTTIHHELVHVFQLSLEERVFTRRSRTSAPGTPLWFIEGLAVSASEGRDTEADMVLRDMVLTGRVPSIEDFWRYNGTFTLYKLGQSVIDFIVQTYGVDGIRAIYDQLAAAPSFESAVEAALGGRLRRVEFAVGLLDSTSVLPRHSPLGTDRLSQPKTHAGTDRSESGTDPGRCDRL